MAICLHADDAVFSELIPGPMVPNPIQRAAEINAIPAMGLQESTFQTNKSIETTKEKITFCLTS